MSLKYLFSKESDDSDYSIDDDYYNDNEELHDEENKSGIEWEEELDE